VGFRPELLRDTLERCFVEARSAIPFDFIADTGLLTLLLPEVAALRGFERSSPVHHKDLWDHTIRVALQIESEPALRWTALLHDVGKVQSRRVEARRVSFLRHEDIGAFLFRGIAARLAFPEELAKRVEYLIKHHSRINHYGDEWTDTAIRRVVRDTEYLDDLLRFSRADVTSRIPGRVESLHRLLDELRRRMVEIEEKDNEPPLLPQGLGNVLMERFDLKPGPLIGVIREYFEGEVLQERLERDAEAGYYVRYVEEHPELLELWKTQKPTPRRRKKDRTVKKSTDIDTNTKRTGET
jgi:poly(A) polymerase